MIPLQLLAQNENALAAIWQISLNAHEFCFARRAETLLLFTAKSGIKRRLLGHPIKLYER